MNKIEGNPKEYPTSLDLWNITRIKHGYPKNILEWEDLEGVKKVYKAQKKNPSKRWGD